MVVHLGDIWPNLSYKMWRALLLLDQNKNIIQPKGPIFLVDLSTQNLFFFFFKEGKGLSAETVVDHSCNFNNIVCVTKK